MIHATRLHIMKTAFLSNTFVCLSICCYLFVTSSFMSLKLSSCTLNVNILVDFRFRFYRVNTVITVMSTTNGMRVEVNSTLSPNTQQHRRKRRRKLVSRSIILLHLLLLVAVLSPLIIRPSTLTWRMRKLISR